MRRLIISISIVLITVMTFAQDVKTDFIENLISKMTLREKIGQLNLNSIGRNSTGTFQNSNAEQKIINGELGSILNIRGSRPIRE